MTDLCRECKQPLMEIDNRGQLLKGCATCNLWWPVGAGMGIKVSVEDLAVLRALRKG
jgi:hypothetical protein